MFTFHNFPVWKHPAAIYVCDAKTCIDEKIERAKSHEILSLNITMTFWIFSNFSNYKAFEVGIW